MNLNQEKGVDQSIRIIEIIHKRIVLFIKKKNQLNNLMKIKLKEPIALLLIK